MLYHKGLDLQTEIVDQGVNSNGVGAFRLIAMYVVQPDFFGRTVQITAEIGAFDVHSP